MQFKKKYFFIWLIMLVIFLPLKTNGFDTNLENIPVKIHAENLLFTDLINRLADDIGVEILINGPVPDMTMNIELETSNLFQALKEIMKKANVINHAVRFDQESKTARVWILKMGDRNLLITDQPHEQEKGLTLTQMQQLEPDEGTHDTSLAREQMYQLEAEDFAHSKSLSDEEMLMLEIDGQEEKNTLSKTQIQQLEPNDDQESKSLNEEQMLQLDPTYD